MRSVTRPGQENQEKALDSWRPPVLSLPQTSPWKQRKGRLVNASQSENGGIAPDTTPADSFACLRPGRQRRHGGRRRCEELEAGSGQNQGRLDHEGRHESVLRQDAAGSYGPGQEARRAAELRGGQEQLR